MADGRALAVVPTGTRPLYPRRLQFTSERKAASSSEPFLKGVTKAVKEPGMLSWLPWTSSKRAGLRTAVVVLFDAVGFRSKTRRSAIHIGSGAWRKGRIGQSSALF